jgi:hypothetical protein
LPVRRRFRFANQIPQVDDASDVIEIVGDDRCPRVTTANEFVHSGRRGLVIGEDDDVASRDEHHPQRAVSDLERPFDDVPLGGCESALGDHEVAQFLFCDLLVGGTGIATEHTHGQVGRPGQQPHHGPGQHGESRQGTSGEQSPALGPLHGDAFGGQLAEHEGQE